MNELLLIASLIVEFGAVLVAYRFFGRAGLYGMTVFATVAANIEVMILVSAFGMDQTLGNILFAVTFLITDILSENEGKKAANKAVNLGIFTTVLFIVVTQSWMLYVPAAEDFVSPSIRTVFANTPRTMLVSMGVYAVVQRFDVWLYHKWWDFSTKKWGDSSKFLWLRNNGSTMISQLANTILFNLGAFAGLYSSSALISIILSGYLIYFVTCLCDTPAVYIARKIKAIRLKKGLSD